MIRVYEREGSEENLFAEFRNHSAVFMSYLAGYPGSREGIIPCVINRTEIEKRIKFEDISPILYTANEICAKAKLPPLDKREAIEAFVGWYNKNAEACNDRIWRLAPDDFLITMLHKNSKVTYRFFRQCRNLFRTMFANACARH